MKNFRRFDKEDYLKKTKHKADRHVAWIDATIKNPKREEQTVVRQAFVYSKAYLITINRVTSLIQASKQPLTKDLKLALLKEIDLIYATAVSDVLGHKVSASSEKLTNKAISTHGHKVTMEHLHVLAFQKLHLVPDGVNALQEVSSIGLSAWIVSGALPSYFSFTNSVDE